MVLMKIKLKNKTCKEVSSVYSHCFSVLFACVLLYIKSKHKVLKCMVLFFFKVIAILIP